MMTLLDITPVGGAALAANPPASHRMRRESLDYDCVRFCQGECSLWKGYDLKHCALVCTQKGLDSFSQNFVHDVCFNMGSRKRGLARRLNSPLFFNDDLQDDFE